MPSPRGTVLHDLSLFGLGAVLVSLHVFAAACLPLILIIHVCVAFRKRTGLIALAAISIMASVHLLWGYQSSGWRGITEQGQYRPGFLSEPNRPIPEQSGNGETDDGQRQSRAPAREGARRHRGQQ